MGPPPSRMEPTGGSGREAHTPRLLPSPAPLERSPLGPATRPTTRSYGKLGPLWPRASACGSSPARRETEGSGGQLARLSHCGHAVLRALCPGVPRLPPALRGPRRPSWCCPFPGLWAHGGPRPRTNRLFSERPSPSRDRGPCWVLACSAGTARSDLGHEVPLPGSAAHMDPEGTGPPLGAAAPHPCWDVKSRACPTPGLQGQRCAAQDVCIAHEGLTRRLACSPGPSRQVHTGMWPRKGPRGQMTRAAGQARSPGRRRGLLELPAHADQPDRRCVRTSLSAGGSRAGPGTAGAVSETSQIFWGKLERRGHGERPLPRALEKVMWGG